MSTAQQIELIESVKDDMSSGTRLGPDMPGVHQSVSRRNAAAKRSKKSAKKPKMEDLLEKLEELDSDESESESESDSETELNSDDYSSDDDSDDDDSDSDDDELDISSELDESDVNAQKVKVIAADLGHRFLQLHITQHSKPETFVMNPLVACCASGNIDLLDEILHDGLFCPKSQLLFLLNVSAAFPIQDLAMKMYDAIKEGAAACSGDPDSGYNACKSCELPKKKKKRVKGKERA